MHTPIPFHFFTQTDKASLFNEVKDCDTKSYIAKYLDEIGLKSWIVEDNYFDTDYLSEFSSFYSMSAKGYKNTCKRYHFFSEDIDRTFFLKAIGNDEVCLKKLKECYLGFVVLRPLAKGSFGHTVLSEYPNDKTNTRVLCKRKYAVHLAGIELEVEGLSWQEQDSAVGACATIAIWSALHSTCFDDSHAIPTTAEITKAAHKTASLGARVFPSYGLSIFQVSEAIKELNLSPIMIAGDRTVGPEYRFSQERFSSICGSILSSNYPIIMAGFLEGCGGHAICMTGYKPDYTKTFIPNDVLLQESATTVYYVHDDNLGPNVRLELFKEANDVVYLKPVASAVKYSGAAELFLSNYKFYPSHLIIPVQNEIRLSIDFIYKNSMKIADDLLNFLKGQGKNVGITINIRYLEFKKYQGDYIRQTLGDGACLASTRMKLSEDLPPAGRYIAVIRFAFDDKITFDLLCDTSDCQYNNILIAGVAFNKSGASILGLLGIPRVIETYS